MCMTYSKWNTKVRSLVRDVISSTTFSVKWKKYDLNFREIEGEFRKPSGNL